MNQEEKDLIKYAGEWEGRRIYIEQLKAIALLHKGDAIYVPKKKTEYVGKRQSI